MRLLTVGDSFTHGDELADPTKTSWPSLLSNKLNYELTNLAKPGGGNARMVRHCIEQVNNYDMVIIAWSQFSRIEFADEFGFYDIWPGMNTHRDFSFASFRSDQIKYFTAYHNDNYLYRQYLINIILLQTFLKANNKKYIMLDAFANSDQSERYTETDLLSQIDTTYYLGWPDITMMNMAWGCPTGLKGHFLEEGHVRVAEKIYQHMKDVGWDV